MLMCTLLESTARRRKCLQIFFLGMSKMSQFFLLYIVENGLFGDFCDVVSIDHLVYLQIRTVCIYYILVVYIISYHLDLICL